MNKPVIIYFIRAEADLERITSIAISGKIFAKQFFAYYGDSNILFDIGIKNKFQKYLLSSNGFKVIDIVTMSFVGKLYKVIKMLEVNNKIEQRFQKLIDVLRPLAYFLRQYYYIL